jgi:hypothetical protein
MKPLAIAAAAAALLMLPTLSFAEAPISEVSSQGVDIQVGPGGVAVGERHRRSRSEREEVRRRGPDCRELRAACLNKDRLGEQGEGNCRRYRRLCR